MKVSVLIPVYNERWTLRELVRRVYEQSALLHEVIVVDDGSTDGSAQRLRELAARYGGREVPLRAVYKERNEGKGAAIMAGLERVAGDAVLIQDADLEYNPMDYPALLAPILAGRADVVYGTRFEGTEKRALLFWHMVGNRALTLLCDLLSNLNLTDVWTGYKVFRAPVLRQFRLRSRGFGFEPEVTIKAAKLGCRIYEVPIRYEGRSYAEGKKIGARDALTGILAMLRAWFSSEFGPVGVGGRAQRQLSTTGRYARFLYDQSSPHLGREVLEVAAGAGGLSRLLLDRDRLVLGAADPEQAAALAQAYRGWEYVSARRLDLARPETTEGLGGFDTALCLQVLEHLDDDVAALARLRGLLKPGGRLLLLVPAHEALFGPLDRELGHRRRYGAESLRAKLGAAGFETESLRFFSPLAAAAWWLGGRLGSRGSPMPLLRLFDRFAFASRWLARCRPSFGLELFVVARRR